MSRYLQTVFFISLIGSYVFADLSAQTTKQNYRLPEQRLGGEMRVAGSEIEGAWTEAFIDLVQFGIKMKSAIEGNVAAGYSAYQEFNQFLDAAGDHAAYDRGTIRLSQSGAYDFTRVKFGIRSDDDPLGILSVAYPNSGSLATGFRKKILGVGSRNGAAVLDVYPKQLPAGKYTIAFYTKENDCNSCLSVSHLIDLVVVPPPPPPQQCGPLPLLCRSAMIELDRVEEGVRQAFDRKRKLIEVAQRSGSNSIHAALEYEKRMMRICNHVGAPGSPQVEACLARIPSDLEGLCPHVAWGVRRSDGLCDRLQDADNAIEAALVQQDRKRINLSGLNCCPKPTGGPINN